MPSDLERALARLIVGMPEKNAAGVKPDHGFVVGLDFDIILARPQAEAIVAPEREALARLREAMAAYHERYGDDGTDELYEVVKRYLATLDGGDHAS
jgi:hypothetical protein